jgi:regulator of replication initiation timing
MRRANEQLGAEVGGLKLRVELLGQDNRRLSEANSVVKRDLGAAVAERSAKVKQVMTHLERELAKLKEDIKRMKGKQDPLMEEVGQLKEATR